MRLQERVMIVTGGASGIGKAIAVRAASEGAKVVIADICEDPVEGGEATVDLIKKSGGDHGISPKKLKIDVGSFSERSFIHPKKG